MPEFRQVFTIMRTLFPMDVIPWSSLVAESNLEKLGVRYKLTSPAYQAGDPTSGIPQQVMSPKGEFYLDGSVLLVEQFILQPASVQFQIAGDSNQANKFIADLGKFFLDIDPRKSFSAARELVSTYETIAIV
jgi:hypothetical protein